MREGQIACTEIILEEQIFHDIRSQLVDKLVHLEVIATLRYENGNVSLTKTAQTLFGSKLVVLPVSEYCNWGRHWTGIGGLVMLNFQERMIYSSFSLETSQSGHTNARNVTMEPGGSG